MGTKLEDLPDEILSMVVKQLVEMAMPRWPYIRENNMDYSKNLEISLGGLALANQRMLRLCRPHFCQVNPWVKGKRDCLILPGAHVHLQAGAHAPSLRYPSAVLTHLELDFYRADEEDSAVKLADFVFHKPTLKHLEVRFHNAEHVEQSFFDSMISLKTQNGVGSSALRLQTLQSVDIRASFDESEALTSVVEFLIRFQVADLVIHADGHRSCELPAYICSLVPNIHRLCALVFSQSPLHHLDLYEANDLTELWLNLCSVNLVPAWEDLPPNLETLVLCCPGALRPGKFLEESSEGPGRTHLRQNRGLKAVRLLSTSLDRYHGPSDVADHGDHETVARYVKDALQLHCTLETAGVVVTPENWVDGLAAWFDRQCGTGRRNCTISDSLASGHEGTDEVEIDA